MFLLRGKPRIMNDLSRRILMIELLVLFLSRRIRRLLDLLFVGHGVLLVRSKARCGSRSKRLGLG